MDEVLINNTGLEKNIIKKDFKIASDVIIKYLKLKNRKQNLEYILNIYKFISQKIDNMKNLEIGYCHNDLHGGNAHILGDYLEFFDFEFSEFYPRAYELSVFKWSCEIGKRYKHWESFLKGYESIRHISKLDKDSINFFVIIRDFIIMASDIEKTNIYGEVYLSRDYFNKRIKFLKKIQKSII